jgi:DNA invertase Pin-like site-specific DNA recombinase
MIFGYARKSTNAQKLHLQIDSLLLHGVEEKNIFIDIISGSKTEREELNKLLEKAREGDTIVTWKIDRVARSVSHFLKLMEKFSEENIQFISLQEKFIDTTSPYGKFIYTILVAVAELERNIIIERTIAGQESARRKGVIFGRRKGLSTEAQKKARLATEYYKDEKKGLTIIEIMKLVGIKSKPTFYSYLEYMGRRNCKKCKKLFWDKEQISDNSYCENHLEDKKEEEFLKKLK